MALIIVKHILKECHCLHAWTPMEVHLDYGEIPSALNGLLIGFLSQSMFGHLEEKIDLHFNENISGYQYNILYHDQNDLIGHYEPILS